MKYKIIKTYGTNQGLSCAFRQWAASGTHCKFIHGYAIGVEIVIGADTLDNRNWVYSYGNLKWVKKFLEDNFDHKTVVAENDPNLDWFKEADKLGIIQLNILPKVGCEMFAEHLYNYAAPRILEETEGRAKLLSVKVFEHEGNAAIFTGE